MRHLLIILAALFLCAAPAQAQTLKSLSFNTSNGVVVANTGTNKLTFNDDVRFAQGDFVIGASGAVLWQGDIAFEIETRTLYGAWNFDEPAVVRANLGFSTNLNTLWTATNAESARNAIGAGTGSGGGSVDLSTTNATGVLPLSKGGTGATNAAGARTAIGLGETNIVTLGTIIVGGVGAAINNADTGFIVGDTGNGEETHFNQSGMSWYSQYDLMAEISVYAQSFSAAVGNWTFHNPITFNNTTNAANTRTNLGLGATNIVTFAGLTNNGDITINQTTVTNGLLYIRRTNNEAFLGLANLIASNNTTVSNETLFRVGVAEETNRAAQFGFRSTNTDGNGVAVFSVFGFNALMMIGADASTNAVIYSGGGTNNEVMTLIRDGATEFARPLRFSTNASTRPATNAPANTTNVAAWVEMRIGTNSYRVPLYQ